MYGCCPSAYVIPVLLLTTTVSAATTGQKPNVLFIVADDLGWNDVSWHNPNIHSPALESLAVDGILLDQYYVMPTCTPSRVAMMTGKYPYRVGRQHMYIKPLMPVGLPVNVNIMPQYFKQAGYTTHAIGKWHLGFCHQNYTPTYRGFDTFYGFYLGSQDYYLHNKNEKGSVGYDFRLNEKILKGPEVEGKYSADLFVQRARALFEYHKDKKQPWFTYLAFQSVHDPLQVPMDYTRNVCKYRDLPRFYYSAMVSAMDDAIDQVVAALKETGQYDNTIIVFTTDNGGASSYGGSNTPLRGTKGTLYEGGTRGIGFIHSPLLRKKAYVSRNLMHAVDWLPTLMSAIGNPGLASSASDGIDQWNSLTSRQEAPRQEMVYNIKEKPFIASIRMGQYKLIWGSKTSKDTWFDAKEDIIDPARCRTLQLSRSRCSNTLHTTGRNLTLPRGIETAESFLINVDEDHEYWDQIESQERMQQDEDFDDEEAEEEKEEEVVGLERQRRAARGTRQRDHHNHHHHNNNKRRGHKKNKGNYRRRFVNKNGVNFKPFGDAQLFDLSKDPEERRDLSAVEEDKVEEMKDRVMEYFEDLIPRFADPDDNAGLPDRWGGIYSPGWCKPKFI